jgi:SAM-dependent methyltransferase
MADANEMRDREGLAWQTKVWDSRSQVYSREIDKRFAPVVDHVVRRAGLKAGQRVLDLGTGTGSLAVRAAPLVAPDGDVLAVDISSDMVALAQERAASLGLSNVAFRQGQAEAIPADDSSFDTLLAGLSFMYVLDRSAAAFECARVLRPGGRLVASVWAGPEQCDSVLLQQTASRFAPAPPVAGVGPGALADPTPFLEQLRSAGIAARVESETLGFDFEDFASAWDALAGVTAGQMTPEQREQAKAAVFAEMWPGADGPRQFRNLTQFIVGQRA